MAKIRMTKQRVKVLEKIQLSALAWGYGEQGGKEYFFTDGLGVSANVIEGMIRVGLLRHSASPLGGAGQEIVRA
jgi:hypothetical protein